VNAGDDVFNHIHDIFDQREAAIEPKEAEWRKAGAIGDRLWMQKRGGKEYARGIVPIDVTTRYYRLRGCGRNTVFVCPVWDDHPATEGTRKLEATPVMVEVVAAKMPGERASDLEKRYDARIVAAGKAEAANVRLTAENEALKRDNKDLEEYNTHLQRLLATLEASHGNDAVQIQEVEA